MILAVVQVFRNVRHESSILYLVNLEILSLLVSFVEGCFGDLSTYQPSTHVDLYLLANTRMLHRHVRQSNILLQKRRRTTRCYMSNSLAVNEDLLVIASNATLCHLEAHELALHAFLFLTRQRFAAGEVALIQFAYPSEIRFEQCGGVVDVVAVERHSGFESQSITRCQAAR